MFQNAAKTIAIQVVDCETQTSQKIQRNQELWIDEA